MGAPSADSKILYGRATSWFSTAEVGGAVDASSKKVGDYTHPVSVGGQTAYVTLAGKNQLELQRRAWATEVGDDDVADSTMPLAVRRDSVSSVQEDEWTRGDTGSLYYDFGHWLGIFR